MNYLLLAAMWIVGIVVYSLGVLQCLICLFCGLPMTSMLGREFPGKVDIGGLRRKYILPMFFWLIISAGVTFAVFNWGNTYAKCGYLIGAGIAFVFSLGKWGMTEQNIMEFLQGAHRYIASDTFEDAVIFCLSYARR